jgi:hypothetical protein
MVQLSLFSHPFARPPVGVLVAQDAAKQQTWGGTGRVERWERFDTGLYIGDFFWRRADPTATGAVALSVVAVVLLAASGWLGGEMVYVPGIAVAPADETAAGKKHQG